MKLSIIIPVYNEERTLKKLLDIVEKVKIEDISKEIIIIDDGSIDATKDILEPLKDKYKIIFHKKNYGKGMAIRTGIKHSTGDIIVIQDADLEYNPEDFGRMIKPIINNNARIVYGSRFNLPFRGHLKENQKSLFYVHLIGNTFLTMMTSILYFNKLTDMETCYKMFRKDVLEDIKLRSRGFDFEPEFTAKVLKKGYRIIEVPVEYVSRNFEEGKKITWKDGITAVWCLLKYRIVD